MKVLYVEGLPRWDFRFLKNAMKRDHGLGGDEDVRSVRGRRASDPRDRVVIPPPPERKTITLVLSVGKRPKIRRAEECARCCDLAPRNERHLSLAEARDHHVRVALERFAQGAHHRLLGAQAITPDVVRKRTIEAEQAVKRGELRDDHLDPGHEAVAQRERHRLIEAAERAHHAVQERGYPRVESASARSAHQGRLSCHWQAAER